MLCNCVGATACLKRIRYRVKHSYSTIKMYFSGHGKLKSMKNRIMEVLESIMPLAQEERRTTVAKIFNKLTSMPQDANFIHVDIYDVTEPEPKPKPATRSAMVNELEKVRLDRSCSICMDEFDKGVIAIRLPCLHIFHGNCIFRWLETDHKCPLCRNPMPHDDVDQYSYEPDDTSPSATVYQHSYYTEIESKTCTPAPSSMLQIRFNLYKSNQDGLLRVNGEVSRTIDTGQIYLETEPQLLTIPSRCELQPTMITQVLRSMSVPRHEQPPIVAKIFETVASNNSDGGGGAFINADIYDETLKLFDLMAFARRLFRIRRVGIDRPITDEIDARVARELAEEALLGKPSTKPATKSAIEGLERVRVDKLCGICMDDFEDGLIATIATRFPCLHIFHGHCILRWLETDHKCPLCRYPLLNL
ncbi:putative transcription factor C2H2 family [Rosa chinensis]|uniref:RING-type E3 ubiquitin transferase n=1 Tax=Rosa chinensis TaxID=74649 RepID=A0A2P6QPU4_ROSCH|nr:putative transcription factor C2H2 family [Rosa chinensis]